MQRDPVWMSSLQYQALEMRRAAAISLALAGGAALALALAVYLSRRESGQAVAIGLEPRAVESWLRDAAEKLKQGSQILIQSVDKQPED